MRREWGGRIGVRSSKWSNNRLNPLNYATEGVQTWRRHLRVLKEAVNEVFAMMRKRKFAILRHACTFWKLPARLWKKANRHCIKRIRECTPRVFTGIIMLQDVRVKKFANLRKRIHVLRAASLEGRKNGKGLGTSTYSIILRNILRFNERNSSRQIIM